MSLLNKEPVKRAEKSLKEFDNSMNVIELDSSARTALDAANSLNCEVGAIVKSLLFRTENTFLLCLISGDKILSIQKFSNILKSNIKIANAKEVKDVTGFSIGGVPPIAHKNIIPIYIDNLLSRYEKIYAAAGHPYCVFEITYKDLCNITNGYVEDLTE